MEAAIRWSPLSTLDEPRFLIVDVDAHTLKHCRVKSFQNGELHWDEISRNSRIPPFRAFDWSAQHDIVALGHYSGATVVGLRNGSPSLCLPLKLPRNCNAVALNGHPLLATGLERVRNDFCLNLYDIEHWSDRLNDGGNITGLQGPDPLSRLAMSETISSVKFFPSHPSLLVAGVKGTCIRIYDLRENTGNPALQYQTTRVHNIAVDISDDWYFASAGPGKDSTVQVWDRRTKARDESTQQDGPLLELANILEDRSKNDVPGIWSLRFSTAQRNCLGVMGSNGAFRICQLHKDYHIADEKVKPSADQVEPLSVNRTQTITYSRRRAAPPVTARAEEDQIVSFDFLNITSSNDYLCAITLSLHQDVNVQQIRRYPPVLARSKWNDTVVMSDITAKEANPTADVPLEGVRIIEAGEAIDGYYRTKWTEIQRKKQEKRLEEKEIGDATWKDYFAETPRPRKRAERGSAPPQDKDERGTVEGVRRVKVPTMENRCKAGYLFDPVKNVGILSDAPHLQELWKWISVAEKNAENDNMVTEQLEGRPALDLGHLGVHSLWTENLGRKPHLRSHNHTFRQDDVAPAIESFVKSLSLADIEVEGDRKAAHRRLCLYSIGFDSRKDILLEMVKPLTMSGRNPEAALRSLMMDDIKLTMNCLCNGPRKTEFRPLADDIRRWDAGELDDQDKAREQVMYSALAEEEDPFVLALYYIITSNDDNDEDKYIIDPLENANLPFLYRLAYAFKFLPDDELTQYLDRETDRAIRSGSVEFIALTGLSDDGLTLFSNYVDLTADLQTALLAMSHTAPKFVRFDPDAEADPRGKRTTTTTTTTAQAKKAPPEDSMRKWREAYRSQLNERGLYLQRAAFDTQSTKLSRTPDGKPALECPVPRQVSLLCGNCNGPLHRDQDPHRSQPALPPPHPPLSLPLPLPLPTSPPPPPPPPSGYQAGGRAFHGGVLGGPREATQCPRCGARMPRCVVCDHWVGTVDPLTRGGAGADAADVAQGRDPLDRLVEVCMGCRHVYHRGHAEAWFERHEVCAAVGCEHRCNDESKDIEKRLGEVGLL